MKTWEIGLVVGFAVVIVVCSSATGLMLQNNKPEATPYEFKFEYGVQNAFNTVERPGSTIHIERLQCVHWESDLLAKCAGVTMLSDGSKTQFMLFCPTIPNQLCVIKQISGIDVSTTRVKQPWERDDSA